MQPTLAPFFRGGEGSRAPKSKKRGRKKASDAPTAAEIWLGQPFRDDAFETAALLTDFLDNFFHTIVCTYGRYPSAQMPLTCRYQQKFLAASQTILLFSFQRNFGAKMQKFECC